MHPSTKPITSIYSYLTSPVKTISERSRASIMEENWVKLRSFFLGNLSTITPAKSEKKVIGINCTIPKTPNLKGEFVIESASQL
jgi:hypothetical protein